jgi:hypothetical protein
MGHFNASRDGSLPYETYESLGTGHFKASRDRSLP